MGWPSFLPYQDEKMPRKTYEGACHCGKFQFEFDHPIVEDGFQVLTCNCSICTAKGALYVYLLDPKTQFRVTKGDIKELIDYRFDRKTVGHLFCGTCGANLLEDFPLNNSRIIAVNMRFAKGLDITKFNLMYLDGKNMPDVVAAAEKELNS